MLPTPRRLPLLLQEGEAEAVGMGRGVVEGVVEGNSGGGSGGG